MTDQERAEDEVRGYNPDVGGRCGCWLLLVLLAAAWALTMISVRLLARLLSALWHALYP